MPLPRIQRGELWLVDLGYLGKVRPVLVLSVPFLNHERALCIVVPHTTSLMGTRFEVAVNHPVLKAGAEPLPFCSVSVLDTSLRPGSK